MANDSFHQPPHAQYIDILLEFLRSEERILRYQIEDRWQYYVKLTFIDGTDAIYHCSRLDYSGGHGPFCPIGDAGLQYYGLYCKKVDCLYDAYPIYIEFGIPYIKLADLENEYMEKLLNALAEYVLEHEDEFLSPEQEANSSTAAIWAKNAFFEGHDQVRLADHIDPGHLGPYNYHIAEYVANPEVVSRHIIAVAGEHRNKLGKTLSTYKKAQEFFEAHKTESDSRLARISRINQAVKGCSALRVTISLQGKEEEFVLPARVLQKKRKDSAISARFPQRRRSVVLRNRLVKWPGSQSTTLCASVMERESFIPEIKIESLIQRVGSPEKNTLGGISRGVFMHKPFYTWEVNTLPLGAVPCVVLPQYPAGSQRGHFALSQSRQRYCRQCRMRGIRCSGRPC